MPGMDEFICVPTENIPMPEKHEHQWEGQDRAYCEICGEKNIEQIKQIWGWDKNLNDFQVVADNLRSEYQESRAIIVEYLIERCKRAELNK